GSNPFAALLDDVREEHHTVEHRDAEERDESNRRRYREWIASEGQRYQSTGYREGNVEEDEQGEPRRRKGRIEQHKDERQRHGHQQHQPIRCSLQVLELASPLDRPAGRQFDLTVDGRLSFCNERPQVTPPHVELDIDTSTDPIAADL